MKLTNKTFYLFAARHYDNPSCLSNEEFEEDLLLFKYIKRSFTKYVETGEIKERLILNQLTILYNLFGVGCTQMLFFKVPETQWSVLKPFLETLDYLPEFVYDVRGSTPINTTEIPNDANIKLLLANLTETIK